MMQTLNNLVWRMQSISIRTVFVTALLALSFAVQPPTAVAQTTPTLTVNAGIVRKDISPEIYGILGGVSPFGLTQPLAAELKVPEVRFGGDYATNYNWTFNSTNNGADYFFLSGTSSGTATPGANFDNMISNFRKAYSGVKILGTIPTIPYINGSALPLCSFPVSVYGVQQSSTMWGGQSCGNGMTSSSSKISDTKIASNYIPNSTAIQSSWIAHIVSTWGNCASGTGVCTYELDNEPSGWSNTHRDVEPTQPDYSVIVPLDESYATMIKTTDPTASVIGPGDYMEWGWAVNAPKGSGLYAGQYFLQQFQAYDALHGSRTLDCFDEHFVVGSNASIGASFSQVRNFWDPNYNDGSAFAGYLGGPIEMIPRFQSWVSTYYPGTPVCMSEYEFSTTGNQGADAAVLADALGVFGYYGLQRANLYTQPTSGSASLYAMLMYRNYDGAGSQFGNMSVSSTSTDPTESTLSVYGALRSSDGKLTVIVINKTASVMATNLDLAGFSSATTADVYTYSNSNSSAIVHTTTAVSGSIISGYNFPSYSTTEFVFTPSSTVSRPAPPTGLTATAK